MQARKVIAILLTCLASACSPLSAKKHKILFISKNRSSPYHSAIAKGAQLEASEKGIDLDITGPSDEMDFATQKKALLRAAHSHEYSAVIVEPNHSSALAPELAVLRSTHVPYIVVDTPLDHANDSSPLDCGFVGTDNIAGGAAAAKFIAEKIQRGNVLIVRGLATHRTSQDREHGFREVVSKVYRSLHISGVIEGNWDAATALRAYKAFVGRHARRIDAVFALNDDMAVAIADYVHGTARAPIVVGFNGGRAAQKSILQGRLIASVVQTPQVMGSIAFSEVIRCAQSGSEHRVLNTPLDIVAAKPSLKTILSFRNDL